MRIFKDNAGRTWEIAVNTWTLKRVKNLIDVNLLSLVDEGPEGLYRYVEDPLRFVDGLYALCYDQAQKLEVSDEDFARQLGGDVLRDAQQAFVLEYMDFFPDPKIRRALGKLNESYEIVRRTLGEELEIKLEAMNEIDVAAEARKYIVSSGSTEEPSASIPARIRSAS